MKKIVKQMVAVLLALLLISAFVLPVAAAERIRQELEVGDTMSLSPSVTLYESSNPDVVAIEPSGSFRYVARAVGKGTAVITGGSWNDVANDEYEITTIEGVQEETPIQEESSLQEDMELLSAAKKQGFRIFGGFSIMFVIVPILIAGAFVLVFASIGSARKVDKAINNLANNPCQDTAEAAVKAFSRVKGLVRVNLSMGGDSNGVHFTMWRECFNRTVISCPHIRPETKEALRQELMRMSTHGLLTVPNPVKDKEAAEAFGAGGEDNVWHNMKFLSGCDIYRNVRIANGNTTSEIDAVIVDPNRGVFLLEIKSVGGVRAEDGHKYITYTSLREDPTNQILRHQSDFGVMFADVSLQNCVKSVLVFSWPNGDERRFVAHNTFPRVPYDIITVEQLLGHCQSRSAAGLTDEQRQLLAERLHPCSREHFSNP